MTGAIVMGFERCSRFVRAVGSLIRWREWNDSKVPLFFVSFYYLCLAEPLPAGKALARFALVTLFACLFLAFGYLINDYSDRDCDRRAGKRKLIASLPDSTILIVLCLVGLGGMAIPFSLIANHLLGIGLTAITYFFAVSYSLPPLRFKERGVWGLVVSAVAQRSFPVLVVFAMFDHYGLDAWLFSVLFGLIGVRWIVVHQLIDLQNDLQTGISTFATEAGYERTRRLLLRVVFPLEAIMLVAVWIYTAAGTRDLWLLLPAYLGAVATNWLLWRGVGAAYSFASYGRQPLSDFYYAVWPLALGIVLALRESILWTLVVFTLLWERSYILDKTRTGVRLLRRHLVQAERRASY